MTGWRFEWRRTWDAVWAPEFVAEWERLLSSSPHANVYHVPALVRAWAETHGVAVGAQPLFAIATGPGGARVLCTFVVVEQRGRYAMRRLLAPAGMSYFGYHDPLMDGGSPHDVDWAGFWDGVRLNVAGRCDHALVPFVHGSLAAGPFIKRAGVASPVLDLSTGGDLDAVLTRCSGSHRRDIRRLLRRLGEALGPLELWVATPPEMTEALADFRDRFLPAYRRVWGDSSAGVMLDRPGVGAFVERVVSDGVAGGWAQYAALKAGARAVAWHVGLKYRRSCYWWIPTYDVEFRQFSPGRLMVALMIERCIRDGVTSLHFLTGDHHYKREWRPDPSDLWSVRWHAPSVKGTALAWYDSVSRLVNE